MRKRHSHATANDNFLACSDALMDVDMVATNTATISNSNSNKTNRNDERYYDTENNDDDDDKEFDEKFLHSSPRRQQAKPGTPHANIVCTVYI